ncbi:pentatricopeptide repeat-containing protein [Tanacetum coccineum]
MMTSKAIIKWPKQVTTMLAKQLIKAERNVEKALIVFDSASAEYAHGFRHDEKTYGVIVMKLLYANEFRRAEDIVERIRKDKCKVTDDIFLVMCRAYGRVHKPHDVMRIFQKMKEYECEPTLKAYITVFSILVDENQLKVALKFYRLGKISEANELLKEMEAKGCSPSVVTYTSLIHGLFQLNYLDEAKALLQEMEAIKVMISKRHKPNMVTYSTLLHGLCKEKNLRDGLKIFDRMKLQELKPDAGLCWKIIDLFYDGHKFQEAANFLDEMVFEGIPIKRVTWSLHVKIHNTVVRGLCNANDSNLAFQIYNSMRNKGISVEAETFLCLVSPFCKKKRDLNKTMCVFNEMVSDGCTPGEDT